MCIFHSFVESIERNYSGTIGMSGKECYSDTTIRKCRKCGKTQELISEAGEGFWEDRTVDTRPVVVVTQPRCAC